MLFYMNTIEFFISKILRVLVLINVVVISSVGID